MKRSFEIADLIVAFVKGEISCEDLAVLDQWIDEAEENRALFVSLMDEIVFEDKKKQVDTKKLDMVFARIKAGRQQIRRKRTLRLFSTIAAAVTIIFGITLGINHWNNKPEILAEATAISVGKQIAYLTLASGEKIELGEKQQDTIGKLPREILLNDGHLKIAEQQGDPVGLEEVYTVEVPRGAEYNLTLADGTQVWLNANTKLTFPLHFGKDKRYVELSGEAYFSVTREESRPFVVHSRELDIAVLGTEFCVRDYTDKPTLTTLVKGSVEVTDRSGTKTLLRPGQQSETWEMTTRVKEVETLYYTAWKDGFFIFGATPLEEIMEELSRWYNCQYTFEDQVAAKLRITARLKKYDEIDVILDILSKTNEIYMEKNGNMIRIRRK